MLVSDLTDSKSNLHGNGVWTGLTGNGFNYQVFAQTIKTWIKLIWLDDFSLYLIQGRGSYAWPHNSKEFILWKGFLFVDCVLETWGLNMHWLVEVGVCRYSDKLRGLFHGIKELVVVILITGLTFSWPCSTFDEKKSLEVQFSLSSKIHQKALKLSQVKRTVYDFWKKQMILRIFSSLTKVLVPNQVAKTNKGQLVEFDGWQDSEERNAERSHICVLRFHSCELFINLILIGERQYQYFFYSSFTAATCADMTLAKKSFSLAL